MKTPDAPSNLAPSTFARVRSQLFYSKLFADTVRKVQISGISPAAKLTYFYLQPIFKQSSKPGRLVDTNGQPLSMKQIAIQLGRRKEAGLEREIAELVSIGVVSSDSKIGISDDMMFLDEAASSYENDRKSDQNPNPHKVGSRVKESRGSLQEPTTRLLPTDEKPLVPAVLSVVGTTEETESPSWLESLRDVEAYKVFPDLREEWLKCVKHNAGNGKPVDRDRFEGWLKWDLKRRELHAGNGSAAGNGEVAVNNARNGKATGASKGKKKLEPYDADTFWDRYGGLLDDMPAIYADTEKGKMKLFKEWLCENIPVHWDKSAVDDIFSALSVYTIDSCKEESDREEDQGWAGKNNVAEDSMGIIRKKGSLWLKQNKP
jgi:hypothetical protein